MTKIRDSDAAPDGDPAGCPTPRDASGRPPPAGPSPEQFLDALRADFAALEEVCRWQWNLIQRLKAHLAAAPTDWTGNRK